MKHPVLFFFIAALLLAACSTSAQQPAPTLDAVQKQGQGVFNLRCAQCHTTVPDTVVIGPSLWGIATRAGSRVPGYDTEAYLETSILDPNAYLVEGFANTMPTNFGKELTSEELTAVIAYLMILK